MLAGAVVLATVIIAAVGLQAERSICVAEGEVGRARLMGLENEIEARRAGLLDALNRAQAAEDVQDAAKYLSSHPPRTIHAVEGRTLGDLNYEREQLRTTIVVDDPFHLRRPGGKPVDPWLLRNYPVDQFGYLYSATANDLGPLRLSAQQELTKFQSGRILPASKDIRIVPNCSPIDTLAYALFGKEHLLLQQRKS